MAQTWIVCPNLWGTRLFSYLPALGAGEEDGAGLKTEIVFLREFPRPKIKTRLEDFHDDDEADEILEPVEDPALERRVAETFMSYVASELEKAVDQGVCESLILCAESHLLEILRGKLGSKARGRVTGTVSQDLYEVNESDLSPYVKDLLGVRPSSDLYEAA